MDVESKVKAWMENGSDFDEGIAILSKHGQNRSLIKFLSRGEPNADKLEHLTHHLSVLANIPQSGKEPPLKELKPAYVPDVALKNYPAHIVALKKEKEQMIKDRAIAHKGYLKLGTANTDELKAARSELHIKIDLLTDAINSKDDEIAAAFKAISSPQPPAREPLTDAQIAAEVALKKKQELDNLVASLSKDKTKAKFSFGDKLTKIKERMATKEASIAALREELKK